MLEARTRAGVFADCLLAWGRDTSGESIEAQAGAFVLAEVLLLIRQAIVKK